MAWPLGYRGPPQSISRDMVLITLWYQFVICVCLYECSTQELNFRFIHDFNFQLSRLVYWTCAPFAFLTRHFVAAKRSATMVDSFAWMVDEAEELAARPVCFEGHAFTPDQLALRCVMARRFAAATLTDNTALSPALRAAYAARPPWRFYTDATGSRPRRVYAADELADGTVRFRVLAAHVFFARHMDGIEAAALVPVAVWSEMNASILATCRAKGVFTDPLGFTLAHP